MVPSSRPKLAKVTWMVPVAQVMVAEFCSHTMSVISGTGKTTTTSSDAWCTRVIPKVRYSESGGGGGGHLPHDL